METLELALSEFTRRSRSLLVAHSATALSRGLEPGETVLVRDGETCLMAEVADISFELTDTHYRLALGREVSPAESGRAAIDPSELVALLREAGRSQRAASIRDTRVGRLARR